MYDTICYMAIIGDSVGVKFALHPTDGAVMFFDYKFTNRVQTRTRASSPLVRLRSLGKNIVF